MHAFDLDSTKWASWALIHSLVKQVGAVLLSRGRGPRVGGGGWGWGFLSYTVQRLLFDVLLSEEQELGSRDYLVFLSLFFG